MLLPQSQIMCLNPSLAGTTSPTVFQRGRENWLRLNPSLAGTTSPTCVRCTRETRLRHRVLILLLLEQPLRQGGKGSGRSLPKWSLNPSLAGTTSPTPTSTERWSRLGRCLNPSLAGTTSPTNIIRTFAPEGLGVLILLLLEQPLRLTLTRSITASQICLNPSLAGTTSPTRQL